MTTEQPTNQDGTNVLVPPSGEAEKVSKPDVEPSAKQTQETENKAYRSLQSNLDKLSAKIASFEKGKQLEAKKLATDAERKRWVENGEVESEEKARSFESVVEKYALEHQDHLQEVEEHKTRVQEFETKYGDTVNSKYLYDKAFPEASDVIKDALAKMADAKTDRERELLAEKLSVGLREQLIEALTPKEKEVNRPDSGRTSISGKSSKNLSPRELIAEGLKKK